MLSRTISSLSPAAKLHTEIGAVAAHCLSTTTVAFFAMWKFTLAQVTYSKQLSGEKKHVTEGASLAVKKCKMSRVCVYNTYCTHIQTTNE